VCAFSWAGVCLGSLGRPGAPELYELRRRWWPAAGQLRHASEFGYLPEVICRSMLWLLPVRVVPNAVDSRLI